MVNRKMMGVKITKAITRRMKKAKMRMKIWNNGTKILLFTCF